MDFSQGHAHGKLLPTKMQQYIYRMAPKK